MLKRTAVFLIPAVLPGVLNGCTCPAIAIGGFQDLIASAAQKKAVCS